jgi:hypothetical protein
LKLPADPSQGDPCQFDYDTISDVILHIRYTAREGGDPLKLAARTSLLNLMEDAMGYRQVRLFSLRHEFPTEWHRFLNTADANGDHVQAFSLTKDRFPFLFQGRTIKVNQVDLLGVSKSDADLPQLTLQVSAPGDQALRLDDGADIGRLAQKTANQTVANTDFSIVVKSVKDEANWTLTVLQAGVEASLAQLEDILVVCHYTVDAQ